MAPDERRGDRRRDPARSWSTARRSPPARSPRPPASPRARSSGSSPTRDLSWPRRSGHEPARRPRGDGRDRSTGLRPRGQVALVGARLERASSVHARDDRAASALMAERRGRRRTGARTAAVDMAAGRELAADLDRALFAPHADELRVPPADVRARAARPRLRRQAPGASSDDRPLHRRRDRRHVLLDGVPRRRRLMLIRLLRDPPAPYRGWLAVVVAAPVRRHAGDALPAQPQRRHHRQRRASPATPATSCAPAA